MALERAEIVVLGAGIAGCALAYHLAVANVGPVAVIDPRTPAAGASGRAAGVVTEQLWNEWDVAVVRDSHRQYAELCGQWDPNAYRQNGFLRWSHRAEALGPLTAAVDRLRGWGVDVDLVDRPMLERRLPEAEFADGVLGLDSPHDACVDPSALTGIYAEAARTRGVRFELGVGVPSVERSDSGWTVRLPTVELGARQLVLAAGAWTKALAREIGHPLPLTPYRTQLSLLRPARPARADLPTGHDIDEDVYVRPEANGRVMAGNGTESVEADPDRFTTGGDEKFLEHIAGTLGTRWPRWGDAEVVAAWAGVCSSTPDRRPLIGAVPGADDLFVIAGFNGFGVMRGGGAGRRLAVLLSEAEGSAEGRELLAPVDPARFPPGAPNVPPRPGFTLEGGRDPRF